MACARHRVTLVASDSPKSPASMERPMFSISGCATLEGLYVSGYDESALDGWAARIARRAQGDGWRPRHRPSIAPRLYTCFDNDAEVRAPAGVRRSLAARTQRPCQGGRRSRRHSLQINRYLAPRRISRFQYDAITTIFCAWNLDPTASW
jgi:uncharacterized protein YecE (DUF72 family)